MSTPIRYLEYCLTDAVLCCAELLQQLCLTFCNLWTVACWLLCPWDYPGKNTRVGCLVLLQRNLPYLGIKPISPASPALQAGSLSTEPPGKPCLICRKHPIQVSYDYCRCSKGKLRLFYKEGRETWWLGHGNASFLMVGYFSGPIKKVWK